MTDKLIIGVDNLIFSMEQKFNDSGIYWDHSEGGWFKSIVGLNKGKKNGYSLLGEFITSGMNNNDYDGGLYLNCNKFDGHIVYQLVKLHDDGALELLQELVDPRRGWAVDLWESIDDNLEENPLMPTYSDSFLNLLHLKSYLSYIDLLETDEETLSGVSVDMNFDVPEQLNEYKQYIGIISQILIRNCDIEYGKIEKPDNLLNLTYLDSFRSEDIGFFLNVRDGRYKQKMMLFYVQDEKLYVKWFNHYLK